jgi:hypothetical protein
VNCGNEPALRLERAGYPNNLSLPLLDWRTAGTVAATTPAENILTAQMEKFGLQPHSLGKVFLCGYLTLPQTAKEPVDLRWQWTGACWHRPVRRPPPLFVRRLGRNNRIMKACTSACWFGVQSVAQSVQALRSEKSFTESSNSIWLSSESPWGLARMRTRSQSEYLTASVTKIQASNATRLALAFDSR